MEFNGFCPIALTKKHPIIIVALATIIVLSAEGVDHINVADRISVDRTNASSTVEDLFFICGRMLRIADGGDIEFTWFERVLLVTTLTLQWLLADWGDGGIGAQRRADAIDAEHAIDVTLRPGEECDRTCTNATVPRLCYYAWTLEHYTAMGSACSTDCTVGGNLTACHWHKSGDPPHQHRYRHCLPLDGVARTIMTINRRLPGPAVNVCRGDRIVVDVTNHMHGTATAMHWHGMKQRNGAAHMDGVPYITQCPIAFGQRFRYAFTASDAGTHFYHAHAGHHKSNGLYGAMIVRDANDVHATANLYDADESAHVVLISDALHALAESLMPGLPSRGIGPDSLLINGRGRWFRTSTEPETGPPLLAVFGVRAGRRYRFRIINSASHMCPLRLEIEAHRMQVIATDGSPVRPLVVDALFSSGGERYDMVMLADGQPGADYWMRVRVAGACSERMQLEQFAVVRYESEVDVEERQLREFPAYGMALEMKGNLQLNHPDADSSATVVGEKWTDFCVTHLQAATNDERDDRVLDGEPDHRLTVAFANRVMNNDELFQPHRYDHFMNIGGDQNLMGTINNISFGFPMTPPLQLSSFAMAQHKAAGAYCDPQNLPKRCNHLPADYPCMCTHLMKVALGSMVEMRIVDDTEDASMSHPFHLHGYSFYVMAIGYNADIDAVLDRIPPPKRPTPKDTVTVPRNGFVVIRFRADNPGYWLLHCHFEWHLAIGMAALLQVGEPSVDIRPPLPRDFPRCGEYRPSPFV